jgi:hypothetical protein
VGGCAASKRMLPEIIAMYNCIMHIIENNSSYKLLDAAVQQ